MIRRREVLVLDVAEIGEAHLDHFVPHVGERQPKSHLPARGLLVFKVPFAALAPPEADRSARRHDIARRFIEGDRLPFGIVGLAQRRVEVGGAHEAIGNVHAVPLGKLHQHRHVGVLADIVAEILGLPVDVILFQDHVTHRHGQRRVGALLNRQPDVAELRCLRVVGTDHGALHAAVASLGVEVGVGRARLRHVRAPENDEPRIVPVGRLGHVGLLAPGLRRGRRQVAVPVVERHANAADQREVA